MSLRKRCASAWEASPRMPYETRAVSAKLCVATLCGTVPRGRGGAVRDGGGGVPSVTCYVTPALPDGTGKAFFDARRKQSVLAVLAQVDACRDVACAGTRYVARNTRRASPPPSRQARAATARYPQSRMPQGIAGDGQSLKRRFSAPRAGLARALRTRLSTSRCLRVSTSRTCAEGSCRKPRTPTRQTGPSPVPPRDSFVDINRTGHQRFA